MTGRQRGGVFLSYARKDGEAFATRLRERLRKEAPNIQIKQDRLSLEGGVGWWKQLTDAIDSVEFLVLVMTPSTMDSETVRKEWRYARQQGVCVYPVKGAPESGLRFAELPRWMGKAHFYDIDQEWETFVAHLRKGCDMPRVPFMAPDLPDNFVQRLEEFERLKNYLLSPNRKAPVAITTALAGAGGFGKTTLAAALCHDEDIVQNFDDGILWVTLGQQPNVTAGLITLYAGLTGERPGFASEEDAAYQLALKLEDRNCLVVIDNVWDAAHLRPFLRGGKGCARLFTTRNARIASTAERVTVDELREAEALAMLTTGIPGLGAGRASELSRRLGEWPIALELAASAMRELIAQGDSAESAAGRLLQRIERKGVVVLEIDQVVGPSFELLSPEDRGRLRELAVFPEGIALPLGVVGELWGQDEFAAEETAQRLARLSLMKLDLQRGIIRIHEVMRSWLLQDAGEVAELHSRLVDRWGNWLRLPHEYAWRWLSWHLAQAGRRADLDRILWDPQWLQAKLDATDINTLIGDFEHIRPMPEAELMQGALRLSAHILARDKTQLWGQLAGRMGRNELQLWTVVSGFRSPGTSLVPFVPTLTPPGQALLRTLVGHTDAVCAVAVDADARQAISASGDKTLKVWDLETGAQLRTLRGHTNVVNAVMVYAEGRRAISASYDKTLTVWDMETGLEWCTLNGHEDSVTGVAVYADGHRAISASNDQTLKVWDLEMGAKLRTLRGHRGAVSGVAVYAKGTRAISASNDRTLKVWDLDTGAELQTLRGHASAVTCVVVFAEDRSAVSASDDKTLKIWDLNRGAELRTLSGHTGEVTAVAVYAEGRRAISASRDQTLKVWDLQTGVSLGTFRGHTSAVAGVAVFGGNRRAISASYDKTLKVWDLDRGAELRTRDGHSNSVSALAIYADGRRAISASWDNTLKIWELAQGAELRTLRGHAGAVTAVAVYAAGRCAVSASNDGTLKVWDLETGHEVRTLSGHLSAVTAVAVYADGRRAISASRDQTLKVWDLETGAELRILSGHVDWVTAVAVDAACRRAVSASGDNILKVWDLETGSELYSLSGHKAITAVAVYSEGRRAISAAYDGTLKVWDLETQSELRVLCGHVGGVNAVAVCDGDRRAISASADGTVRLWGLDSGEAIAVFSADAPVEACAVSSDTLIAGDHLGRVHFLRVVEPNAAIRTAEPVSEQLGASG